jgi:hypothetical protein
MVRDYIKPLGYRKGKRIHLFGVLRSIGRRHPAAAGSNTKTQRAQSRAAKVRKEKFSAIFAAHFAPFAVN